MKTTFKLAITSTLYIILSTALFLYFIEFVQFPENVKKVTVSEQTMIVEKIDSSIEANSKKHVLDDINGVDSTEKLKSSTDSSIEEVKFFQYVFKNNNDVIPMIYILLYISFIVQILLLAWSRYYKELRELVDEKKLDNLFLYTSEWAINAPPVLGVVGTIFSFGMVVSNLSDVSSLSTVFKDNFANAALTTIIGGSVYVINLFINIFIAKNLTKK